MKQRKIIRIVFIIGVVLLVIGLVIRFTSSSNESFDDGKTDHRDEFKIVDSNYLERYYKRYIAYRKEHSGFSDDTIITHVNIGLDKSDYTDAEKTNENDGILMIVNKHNVIIDDYEPKTIMYGDLKVKLVADMIDDFKNMAAAGKKYDKDINIFPVKGYITYGEQQSTYDISILEYGEKTLKTVSKPGYSEYQTGLAIDICGNSENFKYTKEYSFLKEHAYEYGFILRYPIGKENITGFEFNPYHYRYVGKDVAKVIHDKDITFEEYYATYVLK